jgi:hypothetical protein
MAEITSSSKSSKYLVYLFTFLGGVAVLTVVYLIVAHAIYLKKGGMLRDNEIERFSGCGKSSEWYARASENAFSQEWKKSSEYYEFTVEDVDKLINECEKGVKIATDMKTAQVLWLDTQEKVDLLKEYHQKFLNREFSVLKNQK